MDLPNAIDNGSYLVARGTAVPRARLS
ncbi:hypothetical protein KL86PLE_20043 [uncultured Pleomorphomonas sp.]|uniref:Uncharacterized protein n=1 Tax=uncultured Pleomorphomonas sp. TaxID=442121 RepID=A0A212LCW7_9HYPH|nr:hypothetical protein KL86PLE_20043 [uncultured Pleomorphomonas sp.]